MNVRCHSHHVFTESTQKQLTDIPGIHLYLLNNHYSWYMPFNDEKLFFYENYSDPHKG